MRCEWKGLPLLLLLHPNRGPRAAAAVSASTLSMAMRAANWAQKHDAPPGWPSARFDLRTVAREPAKERPHRTRRPCAARSSRHRSSAGRGTCSPPEPQISAPSPSREERETGEREGVGDGGPHRRRAGRSMPARASGVPSVHSAFTAAYCGRNNSLVSDRQRRRKERDQAEQGSDRKRQAATGGDRQRKAAPGGARESFAADRRGQMRELARPAGKAPAGPVLRTPTTMICGESPTIGRKAAPDPLRAVAESEPEGWLSGSRHAAAAGFLSSVRRTWHRSQRKSTTRARVGASAGASSSSSA